MNYNKQPRLQGNAVCRLREGRFVLETRVAAMLRLAACLRSRTRERTIALDCVDSRRTSVGWLGRGQASSDGPGERACRARYMASNAGWLGTCRVASSAAGGLSRLASPGVSGRFSVGCFPGVPSPPPSPPRARGGSRVTFGLAVAGSCPAGFLTGEEFLESLSVNCLASVGHKPLVVGDIVE